MGEWATDSDEEKDEVDTKKAKNEMENESMGPMVLPNGELLLENGVTVGNKMYKTYYAQRHSIKKFDEMRDRYRHLRNRAEKRLVFKKQRKIDQSIKYDVVKESNNSAFRRINTLFKARKQVNV